MNKNSDHDKSNIESSHDLSNNVSQNFLNQSSINSVTKQSMGRYQRFHQKQTISSKGHGDGADDTDS